MKDVTAHAPGWIGRQLEKARQTVAAWPESKRIAAGVTDEHIADGPPLADDIGPISTLGANCSTNGDSQKANNSREGDSV